MPLVTDPEAKKPKKLHYKPFWLRAFAVIICAQSLVNGEVNWDEASTNFNAQLPGKVLEKEGAEVEITVTRSRSFLKRWWEKFNREGTLEDEHRSGRPPLISKADALRASAVLKQGRIVKYKVRNLEFEQLTYYTTVHEAIDENEELRAMVERLGCTPKQLLHAMHQHDPDLARRRITFKRAFSAAELEERMRFGAMMLAEIAKYPQPSDYLQKIVFIDEASVVLLGNNKEAVHAWCSKHATCFSDVCPIKDHKKDPVKAHFIAAVTSHPAFEDKSGLVYMDFTTGTTDIHRRKNTRLDGSQYVPDWRYQVGWLHWVEDYDTIFNTRHVVTWGSRL